MEEQIIKTFDDVKFIKGATKMTQANWQAYFGSLLPNGIYDGLQVTVQNGTASPYANTKRSVTDGVVMANGIVATLKTTTGYTDIGDLESGTVDDRFVCVRVYFGSERADIVVKKDIATQSDYITTAMTFASNELYQCTRNDSYWEFPLFYQSKTNTDYAHGLSLRRPLNLSGKVIQNPDVTGMSTYNLISGSDLFVNKISSADDVERVFYIDPVNLPNGAVLMLDIDTSGEKLIKLRSAFWTNNYTNGEVYVSSPYYGYIDYIGDIENWLSDTNTGCYKTYLGDGKYVYKFTHVDSDYIGRTILVEKICGGDYDND